MQATLNRWRRSARSVAMIVLSAVLVVGLVIVIVGPQQAGNLTGILGRLVQMRAASLYHFYQPPANVSVSDAARNNDFIILSLEEEYRQQLRSEGYQGAIITYVTFTEADGPAPGPCDPNYKGWPNTATYERGDVCSLPEDAFLHNGRGERIYYPGGDEGHYLYFMNPASPAWQEMWLKRIKPWLADGRWDGVFLDNLDIEVAHRRWTNWDGTLQEYPNTLSDPRPWKDALKGFLARARSEVPQKIFANVIASRYDGSDWDEFIPYLDGGMAEDFAVDYPPGYLHPPKWEGMMNQAEKVQAEGKVFLGIAQGTQEDTERMRLALASYFLIDQGKAHFRYGSSRSYKDVWDYPELHVDLGEPLGPRYRDGDTAWKRDFSCGHVRVDPVSHAYEFAPDDSLPTCQR